MTTEPNKSETKSTDKTVAKNDSVQEKSEDIALDIKVEPKSKTKKPRAKKPISEKSRHPISKTAVFTLILSLIIAGAAGYEYYLLQNQTRQLQTQANQNAELSRSQSELKNQLAKLEQDLQSARQTLSSENQALKTVMDTVSAKLGRTTTAWRLAEVEYLLTVANHRLNLVQDRTTAIAVFETADERLSAIGDPGLTSVRKAIAKELNLLRGISEPDLTGMALKLSSLAEDVEKLPLVFKERVELATGEKQKSKPENWRQVPAAVWEEIKGLVVIRRHQQPTEPLLPPTEAWFLHQNLRLKLEQAQLALLRRDTSLFRKNLAEANIWISTFFDADSSAVKNTSSTLDSLAAVELKLDIPDVSGSLRELRRLLIQRDVAPNKKK